MTHLTYRTEKRINISFDNRNVKRTPTKEAIAEAQKHPNGWIYEIVGAYTNEDAVPPEAIKGAWKVNEKGIIEGEFITNPKFVETAKQ